MGIDEKVAFTLLGIAIGLAIYRHWIMSWLGKTELSICDHCKWRHSKRGERSRLEDGPELDD